MRDFFDFTLITKTRPWRHIYPDIGIPRPKNHDIEIPRLKNHNIEISRPKNHDSGTKTPRHREMETNKPRHRDSKVFFRGQKATTLRFQD